MSQRHVPPQDGRREARWHARCTMAPTGETRDADECTLACHVTSRRPDRAGLDARGDTGGRARNTSEGNHCSEENGEWRRVGWCGWGYGCVLATESGWTRAGKGTGKNPQAIRGAWLSQRHVWQSRRRADIQRSFCRLCCHVSTVHRRRPFCCVLHGPCKLAVLSSANAFFPQAAICFESRMLRARAHRRGMLEALDAYARYFELGALSKAKHQHHRIDGSLLRLQSGSSSMLIPGSMSLIPARAHALDCASVFLHLAH